MLILFTIISCSQLETVDKSYLNHQAMNLEKGMTDDPSSNFTNLGAGGASSQAGCATCAK